ncbi:hypothetical protein [Vreelandella neptunia]|jgi:hypothetical protein|uniref:Uncharacterized protein n=1 Tax=Vreelandella neptunia TaxID=115551 RepID=A0ABS9SB00_9GAMM|nr:hypothetical protein [Halomonas neptunia]MCH4813123.1 hypothetical protein [Halomonas neptunia]
MNLIKEKYPELLHEMGSTVEVNENIAIEISEKGNVFSFAYPCDRYGSFMSMTVKIRRDEAVEGDIEAFIDYLIKKIAIIENKIFNQEEKAVLRTELQEFVMGEAEEHINRHCIPDDDEEDEDRVIDQDEARASFERAWEELDNLKK